ncbi:MAG: nucleotidyltransferase family protein [Chitinispirillaceae bacterium]|nr:nucleotidyltransferase family protein [Chitinispirillaceae bacterium]
MDTREEILEFLKANREFLKEQFHVIKIGLFGSFARSEQTPHSDIDLIIEMDADVNEVFQLKNRMREFFSDRCKRTVDLAREKYLRPYARKQILKEAIFV